MFKSIMSTVQSMFVKVVAFTLVCLLLVLLANVVYVIVALTV